MGPCTNPQVTQVNCPRLKSYAMAVVRRSGHCGSSRFRRVVVTFRSLWCWSDASWDLRALRASERLPRVDVLHEASRQRCSRLNRNGDPPKVRAFCTRHVPGDTRRHDLPLRVRDPGFDFSNDRGAIKKTRHGCLSHHYDGRTDPSTLEGGGCESRPVDVRGRGRWDQMHRQMWRLLCGPASRHSTEHEKTDKS